MRRSRYTLLAFVIAAFLFIVPFFWLKPGEIDLGGDSSRLYFYDPIRYMFGQSLFSVSHSAFGGENLSFFGIPFFLLLFLLKSIITSPTSLISVFHGFSLSTAFISCYFIVKEILKQNNGSETDGRKMVMIEVASIISGLYYTLSPVPAHNWGYPILTYNQVFLSPLMFLLLLRFLLSNKTKYMIAALVISIIFAPNFSYIGAPTFFAFYPLSLTFLLIYMKFVMHRKIPVRKLAAGALLFILIHAFHLIPQIVSLVTPGSSSYETVFGESGKVARGLGYFAATAPSIKVSTNLLGQLQLTEPKFYSWIFIVFPLVLVLGFLWNKGRSYLIAGIFFLITLFLVSANITKIGLKLYTLTFRIPGFSMFRVFYGQWMWVHLFFYMLLLGQALVIVMININKLKRYLLVGFLLMLLLTTSWPFINGTLTDTIHWQSKDIKSHVEIDPLYEKVLSYIRELPVDGKILSFPLDDHGYQVLQGKNDAAFIGPSTITYLTNKNEIKGFDELGEFGPIFLEAVRDNEYESVKNMLAMFNIKYIFYNSDPYIYGDNFPGFPYRHVPRFLPTNQEEYKVFIEKLGVEKKISFGDKYHIYEIKDSTYLPHIYVAKRSAYWNNQLVNLHTPLSFYRNDKRVAFYEGIKTYSIHKDIFDDIFIGVQNKYQVFDYFIIKDFPKFVSPTISRKLSSLIYPLVVLREQLNLGKYSIVNDEYIDRVTYFAEKRINELKEWQEIPIRKNVNSIADLAGVWQEPKLWEFTKFSEYNSWEITLARYYKAITELIDKLDKPNQSYYSSVTNKVELRNIIIEHKDKLKGALRNDTTRLTDEKEYIFNLVNKMFIDIIARLNLSLPDDLIMPYEVGGRLELGKYEVYISREDIKNLDVTLNINGKKILPRAESEGEWIRLDDVTIQDKENPSLPITLAITKIPNLVNQTEWNKAEQVAWVKAEEVSGESIQKEEDGTDLAILSTTYNFLDNTSGLIRNIPEWAKDSIYNISFDYNTYDRNFSVILFEKGGTKTSQYLTDNYKETIKSNGWKKFSAAVLSAEDAQSAFLQIIKDQDDIDDKKINENIKTIEIKNLSVVKIPNPKIVLKKVVKPKEAQIPHLKFTKINPTKYKVSIYGAKDPYSLVLLDQFNSRWKIFLVSKTNEAQTIRGLISKIIGKTITSLLRVNNIVISSDTIKESWTDYFNNDIIEGKHKNIFLDQFTFETFGQDPIAEATHLPVNRYANSWYISPSDVQNMENYELIIEMTSQKLFYGSLIISSGGICLLVLILTKLLIKKP